MAEADFSIYIVRFTSDSFKLRYEASGSINQSILTVIETRMKKSFALGKDIPDAYDKKSIRNKANLMQIIFRDEYGYSSIIIDNIL
jgi:hypothetical protein